MKKKNFVYAVFARSETHDTRSYSSLCQVEVELYGVCLAKDVGLLVREVRENGYESQVVRLPLGSLLGDDQEPAYLNETLLLRTYGHWE